MLKYGKIEYIEKSNAKVRFEDLDTLSGWLQICQRGSYKIKSQEIPEVGTKVACLMDDNLEDGCVIGAIYTDEETLPDSDITKIIKELAESFKWVIERTTGILSAVFKEIKISSSKIDIKAPIVNINGRDLISYLNNHTHTNGNQGNPTGKPTEGLPNE